MSGRLKRGMVWLGLVEPEDQEFESEVAAERGGAAPQPAAPLRPAREERSDQRRPARYDEPMESVVRPIPSAQPGKVHLVEPRGFNDAEEIGEKFKADIPVIMNLQDLENDVAKRLIDFAVGLTFGLDGGIQRVADRVFLLTPRNIEVSAEERQRLQERGFFNQS